MANRGLHRIIREYLIERELRRFTESEFPRRFIIGYGSSPSRCRPDRFLATGRTWDLPSLRDSMAGLCAPLPTLRCRLRWRPRTAQGSTRIAIPSSYRTCTDYSLPVSRRTAKDRTVASTQLFANAPPLPSRVEAVVIRRPQAAAAASARVQNMSPCPHRGRNGIRQRSQESCRARQYLVPTQLLILQPVSAAVASPSLVRARRLARGSLRRKDMSLIFMSKITPALQPPVGYVALQVA
jgi:hypothetical protein